MARPFGRSSPGSPRHAVTIASIKIQQLGVFLLTAEQYDRAHAALAVLLGLNGPRVIEACATNIEDLAIARKHGIADDDITHTVEPALAVGEQAGGKVLYLGPDRSAKLLEVVSVLRDDGSEIVIHAMRVRAPAPCGTFGTVAAGEGRRPRSTAWLSYRRRRRSGHPALWSSPVWAAPARRGRPVGARRR